MTKKDNSIPVVTLGELQGINKRERRDPLARRPETKYNLFDEVVIDDPVNEDEMVRGLIIQTPFDYSNPPESRYYVAVAAAFNDTLCEYDEEKYLKVKEKWIVRKVGEPWRREVDINNGKNEEEVCPPTSGKIRRREKLRKSWPASMTETFLLTKKKGGRGSL